MHIRSPRPTSCNQKWAHHSWTSIKVSNSCCGTVQWWMWSHVYQIWRKGQVQQQNCPQTENICTYRTVVGPTSKKATQEAKSCGLDPVANLFFNLKLRQFTQELNYVHAAATWPQYIALPAWKNWQNTSTNPSDHHPKMQFIAYYTTIPKIYSPSQARMRSWYSWLDPQCTHTKH